MVQHHLCHKHVIILLANHPHSALTCVMKQKFKPHTWKFKIFVWRKGWICQFLHETCTLTLWWACMSPWCLHICICCFLEHSSHGAIFGLQQTNFRLHTLYIFCNIKLLTLVDRYQCLRGTCCFYLQSKVPILSWRWRQQTFLQHWYLSTSTQWMEY